MPKRSSSILAVFFLPAVAVVLVALILAPTLVSSLPRRAEQKFGAAAPTLGTYARYRLAIQLLLQESSLTTPLDPGGDQIPFQVTSGESTASIIRRLARDGLIENPGAFRAFLQYAGLDTNIQAGSYKLSPAMTAMDIAYRIQDATPSEITFVILPGWRSEEIAAALPTSGLRISEKAFNSAIRVHTSEIPLTAEIPDQATVEGFLFPGRYSLPRTTNAPDLIRHFLTRFDTEVTSEIRQGFTNQGLSLYEATTLASIVERETVVEEEMPLIASVFLNRLSADMILAADPTVQYAVGFNEEQNTWWTNPLSLKDLSVESLYNTYIYAGLPPGPIANPSLEALRATAFPAQTPYYYFRSLCDESGRHAFAETFEEHARNACPEDEIEE